MASTYDCTKNDDPEIEAQERNSKLLSDHPGVRLPSYCFWDAQSVGPSNTWQSWWAGLDDDTDAETETPAQELKEPEVPVEQLVEAERYRWNECHGGC